ncbi:hypothetical protein A3SI_17394 [Nitritalea halalkaliphila LW7]|uniref:Uncharacterized protein n=1 Tax=Nitritalea halalkaliphila LW7 TaxID=1189621 RepID=I5BVU4_9BACT|nr:hypothetical protein [Nitritalea halalkaliphila]EIM73696.1 hypothetical protein A3SI_17394 [Nitritalea halalkaliphila LW7]
MKILISFALIALLASMRPAGLWAQEASKWSATGYVRELPLVGTDQSFRTFSANNILHQRLNLRYDGGENWSIRLGQRTRYLYGEAFANPLFIDFLASDQGPLPLSHILLNRGNHVMHTLTDRLYLNWQSGDWQLRVGRQRINWGINLVFNPNDLFNKYNFFDFDYDERPGTDAFRLTYYDDALSRWEFAFSPALDMRQSVAAIMRAINHRGYDLQLLTGYFQDRLAVGGGWAGSIGGLGWKGEASYFHDLRPQADRRPGNVVASTSVDYRFESGLFAIAEVVVNQQRKGLDTETILIIEPQQADNIAFSDVAIVTSWQYPFRLIHSFSLASMYFPTEKVVFISPTYSRSLHTNIDMRVLSQLFIGSSGSPLASAGYNLIGMLTYTF